MKLKIFLTGLVGLFALFAVLGTATMPDAQQVKGFLSGLGFLAVGGVVILSATRTAGAPQLRIAFLAVGTVFALMGFLRLA